MQNRQKKGIVRRIKNGDRVFVEKPHNECRVEALYSIATIIKQNLYKHTTSVKEETSTRLIQNSNINKIHHIYINTINIWFEKNIWRESFFVSIWLISVLALIVGSVSFVFSPRPPSFRFLSLHLVLPLSLSLSPLFLSLFIYLFLAPSRAHSLCFSYEQIYSLPARVIKSDLCSSLIWHNATFMI